METSLVVVSTGLIIWFLGYLVSSVVNLGRKIQSPIKVIGKKIGKILKVFIPKDFAGKPDYGYFLGLTAFIVSLLAVIWLCIIWPPLIVILIVGIMLL